ncbi:MAG: hypothetical protein JW717_01050 [Marinilabiliaceae bacterium]|nr:hypothetical protein [Marinilabiliaceae bacterium]
MKKLILLFAIISTIVSSCDLGPGKEELKQKNDSLFLATAEKDRRFNELIESLVEIDENLAQIKEKENIISLNASEANNNEKITDQINNDIKLIYDLMVQNQEKISLLEKQLRSSKSNNSKLDKFIASLNNQLSEKSNEIVQLKEQLKQKNVEISDLSFAIDGLQGVLDSIRLINLKTTDKLEETTTELNKAFYVIGSTKELKEKNILNTEGFLNLKKSVLKKDFDESYFEEIDIRQTISIPTHCKKIKILSTHPENSYNLDVDENDMVVITITNAQAFWSTSKYLVIQS